MSENPSATNPTVLADVQAKPLVIFIKTERLLDPSFGHEGGTYCGRNRYVRYGTFAVTGAIGHTVTSSLQVQVM